MNPFLNMCLNIISGRKVIDERNITLSKRELLSMTNIPFSSFLGFWSKNLKAFGSLFVEQIATSGKQHDLRVFQPAQIEKIDQFLFSHGISHFLLPIKLRL